MRISVIVPIRNEAASIEATLLALLDQDYPAEQVEILVVDGQSEDATVSIVRRLQAIDPRIHLLYNPRRYSSAARNLGILHARGDYIVIVDGHCSIPSRHYFRALQTAFVRSGAETLGRPQPLQVEGASQFQRAVALARQSQLGHNPDSSIFDRQARFVPAENVAIAYRRQVFAQVGLFDEQFDACEDVELNSRIDRHRLVCYFSPELLIYYHPRRTFSRLFTQLARYGTGRARLAGKRLDTLSLPALVPPAWLLWCLFGWLGALCLPVWLPVYFGSLIVYWGVLALYSLGLTWPKDLRLLPWLPGVFMTIHAGFAWGFLRELLCGRRVRQLQAEQPRSYQRLTSYVAGMAAPVSEHPITQSENDCPDPRQRPGKARRGRKPVAPHYQSASETS